MNLKLIDDGSMLTAHLSGELDHHHVSDLRRQLDLSLDRFSPHTLILDFSGVSFMDSSAIGLALGRYHILKRSEGKVVLKGLRHHDYKMMLLAKLDSFMEVYPNEAN